MIEAWRSGGTDLRREGEHKLFSSLSLSLLLLSLLLLLASCREGSEGVSRAGANRGAGGVNFPRQGTPYPLRKQNSPAPRRAFGFRV